MAKRSLRWNGYTPGGGNELTQELIGSRLNGMAELPRTVFLLRHLDGLEVAAIGAQLGIAAEAVERHLAHAMDVLIWGGS